jgi:hypothetical protein
VTPSSGLIDNQSVSLVVAGASPGSTYAVVQCDPTAITLLGNGQSAEDACDPQHNAVVTVDAGGVAAVVIQTPAVMTTSLGAADCRAVQCFVAVESLFSTGGPDLLLQSISFAANACSAPGSCQTAADAWDPSLNAQQSQSSTDGAAAVGPVPSTEAAHGALDSGPATPGTPAVVSLTAGQAGSLTGPNTVVGPYTGTFAPLATPNPPLNGEGLLRLALSAPGTSWGPGTPSSVVADVTVTDTTTSQVVGTQQFVLYDGADPFVYAGFTGPAVTGHSYDVEVAAEPTSTDGGLSWPAPSTPIAVNVVDAQLAVVDPSNPQYLAYAYAPVMYGRSTSALHDVPLLTDATATPVAGGSTQLSYTVIWSHENTGTGFLPFLLWGEWGRMTDIENAISFTVAPDGSVSNASYLWGGEPPTGFPDSQSALQEVDVPFQGTWDGHHPVLRDATGNNDFSDQGTTPFRFQMAPVPGPAPGAMRETVMDANPFTYQVMGDEVARWYEDGSPDPASSQAGDARQYAIIDIAASGTNVSSLAIALQLSGGSTWYTSDFGSGFPLTTTGHSRTVVKLPAGWQGQSITGAKVEVYPASAAASVQVQSFTVESLAQDWQLSTLSTPSPQVVAGQVNVPTAIVASATSGDGQTVRPGALTAPFVTSITNSLGAPLAGVPVTFTASGSPGASFIACGCSTLTVPSDSSGTASSGPATAGLTDGTAHIGVSSIDAGTAPVSFTVSVSGPPVPAAFGYRLAAADGGVFAFGSAPFEGSAGGQHLNAPVVGMAPTSDGNGYWLVAADGGVFTFGNAGFFGSKGGQHLNAPVVGMAPTPDGRGYWLVAADGGVFTFGDAGYFGSKGGQHLNAPVVGMAATPSGNGYWLVAADGGIFTFGGAGYLGSEGGQPLNAPVVGMAAAPSGNGYWLVAADGGVFTFGNAGYFGSEGGVPLNAPVVGMAGTVDGAGYRLVAADGGVFSFGDAGYFGSKGGQPLNAPVVAVSG